MVKNEAVAHRTEFLALPQPATAQPDVCNFFPVLGALGVTSDTETDANTNSPQASCFSGHLVGRVVFGGLGHHPAEAQVDELEVPIRVEADVVRL